MGRLDAQGTVSLTLAMTNGETKDQRSKGYPELSVVYLLHGGFAGGGMFLLQLTHVSAMALQPLAAAAAAATAIC